jgi:23S rRNA (cytosine1962-C5)-methyltransferase
MNNDYELLDSGELYKLERFGPIVLSRPCASAMWRRALAPGEWERATASFGREKGNHWKGRHKLPKVWTIAIEDIRFQLASTDFGHVGIFPEQIEQWQRIREFCRAFTSKHQRPPRVLNLFAYSGGCTLFAAESGAEVVHVDASKGMVEWARKNAALNGLENRPIRWIIEDVTKFVVREQRREKRYDLIILDPPSYGRGSNGEIFKIESELPSLLGLLNSILSSETAGILLSSHTPELTPVALENLLSMEFGSRGGAFESGEMLLRGTKGVLPVPAGSYCWWSGFERSERGENV